MEAHQTAAQACVEAAAALGYAVSSVQPFDAVYAPLAERQLERWSPGLVWVVADGRRTLIIHTREECGAIVLESLLDGATLRLPTAALSSWLVASCRASSFTLHHYRPWAAFIAAPAPQRRMLLDEQPFRTALTTTGTAARIRLRELMQLLALPAAVPLEWGRSWVDSTA